MSLDLLQTCSLLDAKHVFLLSGWKGAAVEWEYQFNYSLALKEYELFETLTLSQ